MARACPVQPLARDACYKCGEVGHRCGLAVRPRRMTIRSASECRSTADRRVCFKCNRIGHTSQFARTTPPAPLTAAPAPAPGRDALSWETSIAQRNEIMSRVVELALVVAQLDHESHLLVPQPLPRLALERTLHLGRHNALVRREPQLVDVLSCAGWRGGKQFGSGAPSSTLKPVGSSR